MTPSKFEFYVFAVGDALSKLQHLPQGRYRLRYLTDLGAVSVIEEPNYFDRDYLSEFKAFYCTSTAGYSNCCRRVHFFSIPVDRDKFSEALSGSASAGQQIRDAYLGFMVLRPIPGAPIGRTVLRWYDDPNPGLPRVTDPSRQYVCHVAGFRLTVQGLAWQQQDTGVGACATIALWTMLHASAFDDWHVVPTTAEVTQAAHRVGFSARPAFPARGLMFSQIEAAVRDWGLTPLVITGKRGGKPPLEKSFDRQHFALSLASFIRSGYPVLIAGSLGGNGHAVCGIGFRQATVGSVRNGELSFEDCATEYVYMHDDNLGPAVRFRIGTDDDGAVLLTMAPPTNRPGAALPEANDQYPTFRPAALLAATHDDVRITPDELHQRALSLGTELLEITGKQFGITASSRISQLSAYLDKELTRTLANKPAQLAKTRLDLCELVPPMSRHVGIVRLGLQSSPLVDVIFDTTDSVTNTRAFCHVVYHHNMMTVIQAMQSFGTWKVGEPVEAF